MCDCDHTVMTMWDTDSHLMFIDLSQVNKKINDAARYANQYNDIFNHLGEKEKTLIPRDFVDRRLGLSTLFNYCPNCGAKIDWRAIKKGLTDE